MTKSEVTVPEVARLLGLSIPYTQALIRRGRIKGRKTTQGWVADAESLKRYIQSRQH